MSFFCSSCQLINIIIHYLGNTTLKQNEHEKYVLFIEENTPIGTIIGHVILNDIDSNGKSIRRIIKQTNKQTYIHIFFI